MKRLQEQQKPVSEGGQPDLLLEICGFLRQYESPTPTNAASTATTALEPQIISSESLVARVNKVLYFSFSG